MRCRVAAPRAVSTRST
jgi:hypothetical protein